MLLVATYQTMLLQARYFFIVKFQDNNSLFLALSGLEVGFKFYDFHGSVRTH